MRSRQKSAVDLNIHPSSTKQILLHAFRSHTKQEKTRRFQWRMEYSTRSLKILNLIMQPIWVIQKRHTTSSIIKKCRTTGFFVWRLIIKSMLTWLKLCPSSIIIIQLSITQERGTLRELIFSGVIKNQLRILIIGSVILISIQNATI